MHPILEFDKELHLFQLSAVEKIEITTEEQLNLMCNMVRSFLVENSGGQRCYMVVDISKLIIEPDLSPIYARHIEKMDEDFLYSNGLIRYGATITRVTARLGSMINHKDEPIFFRTKDEAIAYVRRITKEQPAHVN